MHTNMHTLIQKKDSHLRLFYGRREPPLLVQSVVWPFEIILALFMFFNRFSPIATPSLSFGLVGANADILFHCVIAHCVIHPPFLSAKKVKRLEMSQTVKPYRLFGIMQSSIGRQLNTVCNTKGKAAHFAISNCSNVFFFVRYIYRIEIEIKQQRKKKYSSKIRSFSNFFSSDFKWDKRINVLIHV